MANFIAAESARMLRGIAGVLSPASVATETSPTPSSEYRIDDLARVAGVSVRNVRVYQDRGLLPPPRREGRTGWYNEAHLSRLKVINRMLDRGYTFATISELLTAAQFGMRVEEILDTDRVEVRPSGTVESGRLGADELRELIGTEDYDANLDRALASGLLKREGQSFRIANPRLVEATELLLNAGVPLPDILDNAAVVRLDLRDVANRFVNLVTDQYLAPDGPAFELDATAIASLSELINKGRALVHDVVHSLLVDVMDEAIVAALESVAETMSGSETTENTTAAG
ncbi:MULTISPECIES: MerR family transcriptional regulator [Antrihabitans]|jgi:DNA-binding transcriptional MerR regulator|uniref:MerR family transcriptional regulator n=2 Tax=Antrihabitans TaxID=2799491 RepID=A0A934U3B9_9NOCA|nr:MerR family transcriptional regulator [Antrihabitans stalagmiti]MBJ8339734.1 MerR family transcriptional regulator [Antrihabitans stalagmiti]